MTGVYPPQVEGYTQQLMLAEKEVDSCRTRDELTGTRGNVSNMYKNSSSATSKIT